MTQNVGLMRGGTPSRATAPSLSLRQPAPADWHHDRPAFAGDPYMDWESEPEPPREPGWGTKTTGGATKQH
jgi:hypothetical protein